MSGLVFVCPHCGSDLDPDLGLECATCGAWLDPAAFDIPDYDPDHYGDPDET